MQTGSLTHASEPIARHLAGGALILTGAWLTTQRGANPTGQPRRARFYPRARGCAGGVA